MRLTLFILGAALAAVGCTEKPQNLGTRSASHDETPYAGTKYPYAAPGWTAGDEKGWKDQLKVRTQRGQNEYSRM